MTKSTKHIIFLGVIFFLIIYAVASTYIRVYIQKDYFILNQVSCNPVKESCFVSALEQSCIEIQSDNLNCATETEPWFYKNIYKKASRIPFCEYNPELGESCPELTCESGESLDECYYEYCEEGCAEVKESNT